MNASTGAGGSHSDRADAYRISPRVVLLPGDLFRVTGGGPSYRLKRHKQKMKPNGKLATTVRIGERGVFRLKRVIRCRSRVYLDASKIESGRASSAHVLFVSGRAYRSRVVPGVMVKPYRIRRLTRKQRKSTRLAARPVSKKKPQLEPKPQGESK